MNTELEQILLKCYKEEMIAFLQSHPEHFDEAVKLAIADKPRISWRAAWLIWSCLEENDPRIRKHVKSILKSVPTKPDGHQRELLRILMVMKLKDNEMGLLFNMCLNLWENIEKTPSVRFIAFKFITRIAKIHTELTNEITFLTQNHYLETLSPGVRNSVKRMIKELPIRNEII
ncbi:MAG: hypothetical protein K9J12_01340 [Melioribacteraceae bacterium]|nr:hypothetical protein [Melioribacteraceae bacterium]MCF8265597.1 hypothetical protein [Melioribacteraceae bacterium]MCF8413373.1 hypothetical protein [Melioribacteraceae bacterium]